MSKSNRMRMKDVKPTLQRAQIQSQAILLDENMEFLVIIVRFTALKQCGKLCSVLIKGKVYEQIAGFLSLHTIFY